MRHHYRAYYLRVIRCRGICRRSPSAAPTDCITQALLWAQHPKKFASNNSHQQNLLLRVIMPM
eukprot:scaffold591128_cov18-Prasinocladus_malaysianus.AAC.1